MVSLQEITDEFNRLLQEKGMFDEKCSYAITYTGAKEMVGQVVGDMDEHFKITIKLVDEAEVLSNQAKEFSDFAKGEKWEDMSYSERLEQLYGTPFVDFPSDLTSEQIDASLDFQKATGDWVKNLGKNDKSFEKAIGTWSDVALDKLDTSLTRDERDEVHSLADDRIQLFTDHKTNIYHTPVNEAWGFDKDTKFEYMGKLDNGISQIKAIKSNTK